MNGPSRILAVVGSRCFANPTWREEATSIILKEFQCYRPTLVISGDAQGIDKLAEQLAGESDIPFLAYLPRHHRWAPNGYQDRNRKIAERCTRMLAIRSRSSRTFGSGWTVRLAQQLGREVRVEVLD